MRSIHSHQFDDLPINRNSHSIVTANSALLIRGSHSVASSQLGEAYVEQRFAFGGSGRIEFVTDTDFYNTPFRMCLQITQPKFNIRYAFSLT